jgi:hypothetical protein
MLGKPAAAVLADQPPQAVGVPGGQREGPVFRHHYVRRVLARERAGRHHRLPVDLAAAELGQQPPGHVGGGGVDRAGRRQRRHGPLRHRHDDAIAALVGGGVVGVGEHVVHRQLRPVHSQRRQQPGSQVTLPPGTGDRLDDVAGQPVAQVAVLKRLAQVLAQRQEPQPADQLGAGPVRVTDPGQVMAGQAGPVSQQVDHAQAFGDDRIVQPDLGNVIPERALPVEQPVIDQRSYRRHRECLRDRPDGEQGV